MVILVLRRKQWGKTSTPHHHHLQHHHYSTTTTLVFKHSHQRLKLISTMYSISQEICTRFLLCCAFCGYTLTDFAISTRLTSLALWQSNDCPSASIATLMHMDKYFMWIHYERLHNHNKAKHNKSVCIFLGIYCKHHVLPQSKFAQGFNRKIKFQFFIFLLKVTWEFRHKFFDNSFLSTWSKLYVANQLTMAS